MKQIVIDVPENKIGKVTKQDNGNVLITFEDKERWKSITNISQAIAYLEDHDMCQDLIAEYRRTKDHSYSENITLYRIVVAALTNNEERHLTTGDAWYPVVQFCKPGKEGNCYGSEIIGTIESEGQKFTVVGGSATNGAYAGLGYFLSNDGVSYAWTYVGFRSVSSREIANHISKYFGRLLFEIQYGGVNCNWKWC